MQRFPDTGKLSDEEGEASDESSRRRTGGVGVGQASAESDIALGASAVRRVSWEAARNRGGTLGGRTTPWEGCDGDGLVRGEVQVSLRQERGAGAYIVDILPFWSARYRNMRKQPFLVCCTAKPRVRHTHKENGASETRLHISPAIRGNGTQAVCKHLFQPLTPLLLPTFHHCCLKSI